METRRPPTTSLLLQRRQRGRPHHSRYRHGHRRGALALPDVVDVDIHIDGLIRGSRASRSSSSETSTGPTIRADYLQDVIASTSCPILVAVTGDVIDGFVPDLGPQLAPLKRLQSKLGTFAVTGNHEYYWRGSEWVDFFGSELGMRVRATSTSCSNLRGIYARRGARPARRAT